MKEQDESKKHENVNGQLKGIDVREISRRNFVAGGCAVTAALFGGAGNLSAETLYTARKAQDPTFVVPSPDTVAAVESALRDTLERGIGGSFQEAKDQLTQYRLRLEDSLAHPRSFLSVGPEFFKSPDGEALLASLERLLVLIEDTSQAQLSDCGKAQIRAVAEITVGAIFGGPAGAVAGFILGVVDVALEC